MEGLEASLDGLNATVSGTNIYDFTVPAPYSGALVIKPVGAVGNGSPYPVDQVYIELFDAADASGVFGNATFIPALEVLKPSLVAWYTVPGLNAFSTAKIESQALAGNNSVSVQTTVDKSRLRVYYVSLPRLHKLNTTRRSVN